MATPAHDGERGGAAIFGGDGSDGAEQVDRRRCRDAAACAHSKGGGGMEAARMVLACSGRPSSALWACVVSFPVASAWR
jgi:hypothetical protein